MIVIMFLITKTMIILVMEDLVRISLLTVILMTYRRKNIEKKKLTLLRNWSGKNA